MEMKICKKCGFTKDVSEFWLHKLTKDGLFPLCKKCQRDHQREYRSKNRELVNTKQRKYREETGYRYRDYQLEYNARYRSISKNKEKNKIYQKEYRSDPVNVIRNRNYQRNYQREYCKTYWKERLQNEPDLRIKKNLRDRLRREIKKAGGKKTITYSKLIDCTPEFLRHHLESQFTDGMNWVNYGKGFGRWSIDHIIPCSSFDLADVEQQKKCFHYTNLQPMWDNENSRKGNRLI